MYSYGCVNEHNHCSLSDGSGNEDSVRKTAKDMSWVLTRGALKTCTHCVMAKAKHEN